MVDKDDVIYFGGDLRGTARLEPDGEATQDVELVSSGGYDAFAVKWSSDGRYLWHLIWGGEGDELCKGEVERDSNGGLVSYIIDVGNLRLARRIFARIADQRLMEARL